MDEGRFELLMTSLTEAIAELRGAVKDISKTMQDLQISNNEHTLLIKSLTSQVELIGKRIDRHSEKITTLENKTANSKANWFDKISWVIVSSIILGAIGIIAKSVL